MRGYLYCGFIDTAGRDSSVYAGSVNCAHVIKMFKYFLIWRRSHCSELMKRKVYSAEMIAVGNRQSTNCFSDFIEEGSYDLRMYFSNFFITISFQLTLCESCKQLKNVYVQTG